MAMSIVIYNAGKDESWYTEFWFEDNEGNTYTWQYSRMFPNETYVEKMPNSYVIDVLDGWFQETRQVVNWG